MRSSLAWVFLSVIVFGLFWLPQSLAEEPEKPHLRILRVDVRGNQVVSTQTILNKMKTQPGTELTQQAVNDDIKRLYATGFFQDIRIDVEEVTEGVRLMVVVEEKPIIRRIVIQGNQAIPERQIRNDLNLIEGQILDEFAVKEGVQKVQERYTNKGFQFVTIRYQVETERGTKEATVVITIDEGAPFRIGEVRFEGVTAFQDKRLRRVVKTKARNPWLLRRGVFREEKFKDDLDRLSAFYQSQGFLDARVAHRFEHDPATKKMRITIQVEEGKRYQAGRVELKGVQLFPASEVWQLLQMLPDTTYSQQNLAQDVERVRNFYYDRGHMDVRMVPDVQLNRETGRVDVTYQIEEGEVYFVDQVKIRGNTKTKDLVIRRELRIRPGDQFEGEKIKRSRERLENLNFFEEVSYDTEPGSAPNRKDILFRVKEKRTGELSFGAGISSIDQFIGFGEIAQRNFDLLNWPRFTGGGQSLSLHGRWGTITRNFELSFVEPYLFHKPVSFGLDLFDVRNENRNVDFREERIGFGTTFSKAFTEYIRAGLGYRLERVELFDISEDAASVVRLFSGKQWLSRVKLFLARDTRNNILFPTKGWVVGASGELVGTFLGGQEDYYILEGYTTKYWNFQEGKHVIEWTSRLGASDDAGSDAVPVFDRFYAGGLGTVRGFNFRRVGPIEGGSAIGGSTMVISNLEYTFPIPYLENFKAAAFVDVGNVDRRSYRIDFGEFRVSVGPGIKVKTPLGPIAFYYGIPVVNRDTEDKNGRFEFSISRGF